MELIILEAAKILGAAIATCCLLGSAIGIGSVFGGFLMAFSRNSFSKNVTFPVHYFGFCIVWSCRSLGLMVGFFLLFKQQEKPCVILLNWISYEISKIKKEKYKKGKNENVNL